MNRIFEEWWIGLPIIIFTLLSAWLVRATLKRTRAEGAWSLLRGLAPLLSWLIYIIGIKLFIDAVSITPKVRTWLADATYLLGVVIVLALIRKSALISIELMSRRTAGSKMLQQGFIPLIRNIVTLFVFLTGSIMALKHYQYDVMSLVTALGVGSLAVGLAAKDTLSNMISGFTLIIDRNLRPGDRVNLAGTVGDLDEIGLRSTRIRVGDGNVLIVPNSEMANTRIINLSLLSREASCNTTIRVGYEIPFEKVKTLCLKAIENIPQAVPSGDQWVNLTSIGEGRQLITIGMRVSDLNDVGATLSEMNHLLVSQFEREGIRLL